MEDLQENLFMDVVPPSWEKLAYPSMLSLGGWFQDLTIRIGELANWATDFAVSLNLNDCFVRRRLIFFCFSFPQRFGWLVFLILNHF